MTFQAFHLHSADVAGTAEQDARALRFSAPTLDGRRVQQICTRLRAAGDALQKRTTASIIASIDRAAQLLGEGDLHAQALALLPLATGYSPPMVALVLERMLRDWRAPALEGLVKAELGAVDALDATADGLRTRRAQPLGPRLCFQVFSGNVPGVAVTAMIRALLVKAPSLCKTALGEPVLPVLFARALAGTDTELAAALAVTYWPGGDEPIDGAAIRAADTVVVYGGAAAVETLRAHTRPAQAFIEHGPRFSIGIVQGAALQDAAARLAAAHDIALAAATFDQQGCVSPHVVYVVGTGADARALAADVAAAFRQLEHTLPRGRLEAGEASAIHGLRAQYEFRAIAGADVQLFAGDGTSYSVIYDGDPTFQPSCLNRFLFVQPLPSLAHLGDILGPHDGLLQSVALLGFANDEAAALTLELGRFGASRVTSFAALPWPPPTWHHDGRGPLRELLHWVDLETAG